jgi:uncharacterized protein YndB with AHSA1/START domain
MKSRSSAVLVMLLTCAGPALAQETGPIVAEGVVEAPAEAVWDAWATGEGLRSWLALHADIDLRVVGLGFQPDEQSQQMRAFFERGNVQTLQALQRHFAPGSG